MLIVEPNLPPLEPIKHLYFKRERCPVCAGTGKKWLVEWPHKKVTFDIELWVKHVKRKVVDCESCK